MHLGTVLGDLEWFWSRLGWSWVALGRFKLNKARELRGQNRSGATPADVSELFQSATWEGGAFRGGVVTRPLGE